jgi:hypothetical protein
MLPQDALEQQTENPLFVCTQCGAAVVVYGGNYFRTCEHEGVPFAVTLLGLQEVAHGLS